ncbi:MULTISPECIES: formate--tetrahydrofolate ligase [Exiguobacterium]|uniref:formate--tetrahydrofolate ligase n=1 Tax=Exiguobacterium TaxID=33986 RepID=UPI001BEB25EA|nr:MULTISPECIES: formate--tetrahydrofolate ligase [Exiguobacterium]MCT4791547.1 formate--tetrahydrofolate ligase [Exiguobacterium artemiae]
MEKTIRSDLEIAQQTILRPISEIAEHIGLTDADYDTYGKYKAKLTDGLVKRLATKADGKLILVTAINPTAAGEGKSTVTVGLGQALHRLNHKTMICLREPSLGPTMGLKGGACGGGYSQVLPMEEINLHFTGDMHAITSAHNTISALLDNHLHQGNDLRIDPRRITWKRVLDLNDRALRQITIGLGGPAHGVPRQDGFDITVASEIMAVLCLADSITDLEERISRIVVAYSYDQQPVTVKDIKASGAATLLLKEAFRPNLVQTVEGTPALIHGGPFANIAHGCNSLIATRTALKLSDYVVTEAGFGADLGAEKFFNIKSRIGHLHPDAVVVVATVRALKMHGGVAKDQLAEENLAALVEGLALLEKHVETMDLFGVPAVVALNRFATDTDTERETVLEWCRERNIRVAESEVFSQGGAGGEALAEQVFEALEEESQFTPLYPAELPLTQKIERIAKRVYGAADVHFEEKALRELERCTEQGLGHLPICMAKTPFSLTDDPSKYGRVEGFTITVREIKPSIGAGFIVALTGNVLTMPGLPKIPAANKMGISEDGTIYGLS